MPLLKKSIRLFTKRGWSGWLITHVVTKSAQIGLHTIISKYKRKIPNEFRIKKFKRRLAKGSKISREKAVNIKISKC